MSFVCQVITQCWIKPRYVDARHTARLGRLERLNGARTALTTILACSAVVFVRRIKVQNPEKRVGGLAKCKCTSLRTQPELQPSSPTSWPICRFTPPTHKTSPPHQHHQNLAKFCALGILNHRPTNFDPDFCRQSTSHRHDGYVTLRPPRSLCVRVDEILKHVSLCDMAFLLPVENSSSSLCL